MGESLQTVYDTNDGTFVYQLLTLLTVVMLVSFLENNRPGHPVDRKLDLGLNILSLIVVIVFGELSKKILFQGFSRLHIESMMLLVNLSVIPGPLKVILGVIFVDFSLYWIHRAMHRKFLWRTHAFHHSLKELWWLSGSRTSITHLMLFAAPQIFFAYYLLMLAPIELAVAFSISIIVNIWIHANLRVAIGPLAWLLITPNYHRVHHGAGRFSTQNLGFVLTLWDRMFGTYVNPQLIKQDFSLGSVPLQKRLARMIIGM